MVLHVASIPFGNYVKIYNAWICVLLALKTYNPCTHAAHRMSKKRVRVSLGKREQKMREGTPANCTVNHWWFKELKERNLVGLFFTKITMSEVSHKIANWSTLTFSVYVGFARIIQQVEGTKSKQPVPCYWKASSDSKLAKLAANIW